MSILQVYVFCLLGWCMLSDPLSTPEIQVAGCVPGFASVCCPERCQRPKSIQNVILWIVTGMSCQTSSKLLLNCCNLSISVTQKLAFTFHLFPGIKTVECIVFLRI